MANRKERSEMVMRRSSVQDQGHTKAASDITWHHTTVSKSERRQRNGHGSAILWLTGLSASGKSTLANAVDRALFQRGFHSYVLDGDNVRHGLNHDLGFSETDRNENIRRIGEVAKLFIDAGIIVSAAFISPYAADRQSVRRMVNEDEFIEVYVQCSIEECERRDPKGLYQKARKGEIAHFTGVSAPYEEPKNPEIFIDTGKESVESSVQKIVHYLAERGIIPPAHN